MNHNYVLVQHMRAYMHACMHMYIHAYIHTYIHTHTSRKLELLVCRFTEPCVLCIFVGSDSHPYAFADALLLINYCILTAQSCTSLHYQAFLGHLLCACVGDIAEMFQPTWWACNKLFAQSLPHSHRAPFFHRAMKL